MQLAMAMEEQFGVSISDAAVAGARTLGDLRCLTRTSRPEIGNDALSQSARVSPDRPSALQVAGAAPASVSSATRYPHWPWRSPVQFLRMLFIEWKLRPLVWLLAHPRVRCDRNVRRGEPTQPSIYIANHVTAMDVPLVLYALPHRVRAHMAVAMSAELLAAWRRRRDAAGVGAGPLRWLAPLQAMLVTALLNVFPLPAGAGLRRSFAHAGEALDRGYNVLVFPEGQRTLTGELQPFQTGISLLAQESHTAVVPIALVGLWTASQSKGFSRLRPPGLEVRVGKPMQQQPNESHLEFSERLYDAVAELLQPATPT
jgi:long-chain acyl-CoA synthetase